MTDSAAADLERADGLVAQALAAAPGSALVHLVKGHVLRAQNRWEQVIPEFETALALNRNFVGALQGLGQCKLLAGSIDEAIPLENRAARCLPHRPFAPALPPFYALKGDTERVAPNSPKPRALFEATCFAGPRKAGMPEE
jgi:tetratricopeptide (TPR) repeat protein